MLPFQTTFYDSCWTTANGHHLPKRHVYSILGKYHTIGALQPVNKTNARKLVFHIFIKNDYSTSKQRTTGKRESIMQDSDRLYITSLQDHSQTKYDPLYISGLKTRLPHHLLNVIDITYHFLKHLKLPVLKILLSRYCPTPLLTPEVSISNLIQAYTPTNKVFLFIRSILTKVLPKNIWGSLKNSSNFYGAVRRLLNSRKHDKITMETSIRTLKIEEMNWLKGKDKKLNLEKFIYWLMNEFVFVLLKRLFYITENSDRKNMIFFYRKEIWAQIIGLHAQHQVQSDSWKLIISVENRDNSCCIELHEHVKGNDITFYDVRPIPKTKNVRLVMSKREVGIERGLQRRQEHISIKTLLVLLTGLWKAHPVMSGSSGFGIKYIHKKWRNFMKAQSSHEFSKQKMKNYFVKVDVARCFDTIPHNKLLEVLRHILLKYPYSRIPLSAKYGCISHSTEEVWESLKMLLQNYILRLAGRFYIKTEGIPQGLPIASILCNLFYGHLEQQEFPNLLSDSTCPNRVLMRVIDDFLFVTTDLNEALDFLNKLHNGYPDYGLKINPSKTTINFNLPGYVKIPHADCINVLDSHEPFPWFGHLFLPKSNFSKESPFVGHGIAQDYSRCNNLNSVRDVISINDQRNRKRFPFAAQQYVLLYEKSIIAITITRLTDICCDRLCNSHAQILRNIFEISILSSLQWLAHFYMDKESRSKNVTYCIQSYKNIVNMGIIKTLKCRKVLSPSDRNAIMWTSLMALKKVLSRHHFSFKFALKNLKQEISKLMWLMKKSGIWNTKKLMLYRVTAHYPKHLMKLKVTC
uniref:telomerase reverse transcriptase-like n=1 Tax=Styela clava TaxID=7725 RepID=UPI00193A04E3|nr:telomerase reverse transcriptase-like [Styela clava]